MALALSAYEVRIEGIADPELRHLIQSISQLEKLKENPPATALGLKRRAEGDLPSIIEVLHSRAYYNAKAVFTIQKEGGGETVIIKIDTGPLYPLAAFQVLSDNEMPTITLDDLNIKMGEPAVPSTILDTEDKLLDLLDLQGYAYASIEKQEVLVDQTAQSVTVIVHVQPGALAYFGPVTITGLDRVSKSFVMHKLYWKQGCLYNPLSIERTQEALDFSGLFSAVTITLGEKPTEDDEVPITINLKEGKQRSIGFGVNYSTELGPGISAEWEDRNSRGNGEKLRFRADVSQRLQEGSLAYIIPDFKLKNQSLIWQVGYQHEEIKAFKETALSLSGTIERHLNKRTLVSYGLRYMLMESRDSAHNGTFDLLKAPFQWRWSNTDSLLNPTRGNILHFKITPTLRLQDPLYGYCINQVTGTYYKSLWGGDRAVFAAKLQLGTILGSSEYNIPPPERFYAGSDTTLRGYNYLTVSPLIGHKPIGGRSMMIASLETRFRIGESFGWTLFYDVGNVYYSSYPEINHRQLQSVGLGLRYHTPVGPLRCDIAVPLNRRPGVDSPFQVYFSIGQAF